MNKKVAILIGSETDRTTMEAANKYYDFFGINYEIHVKSAHRNPSEVEDFTKNARANGYAVLVGAAGMAAHLAGAIKANTTLPVIGVPLAGGILDGMDSLLSTVQMPKGVPVATVAVGKAGAINAAILSAEIISLYDEEISSKLDEFKLMGAKL
jgi:5-(carboxyamino)imidazole ribonucleotide mutase